MKKKLTKSKVEWPSNAGILEKIEHLFGLHFTITEADSKQDRILRRKWNEAEAEVQLEIRAALRPFVDIEHGEMRRRIKRAMECYDELFRVPKINLALIHRILTGFLNATAEFVNGSNANIVKAETHFCDKMQETVLGQLQLVLPTIFFTPKNYDEMNIVKNYDEKSWLLHEHEKRKPDIGLVSDELYEQAMAYMPTIHNDEQQPHDKISSTVGKKPDWSKINYRFPPRMGRRTKCSGYYSSSHFFLSCDKALVFKELHYMIGQYKESLIRRKILFWDIAGKSQKNRGKVKNVLKKQCQNILKKYLENYRSDLNQTISSLVQGLLYGYCLSKGLE